jgi:hypothetical protein
MRMAYSRKRPREAERRFSLLRKPQKELLSYAEPDSLLFDLKFVPPHLPAGEQDFVTKLSCNARNAGLLNERADRCAHHIERNLRWYSWTAPLHSGFAKV